MLLLSRTKQSSRPQTSSLAAFNRGPDSHGRIKKWLFQAGSKHRVYLYASLLLGVFEASAWPLLAVSIARGGTQAINPTHDPSEVLGWVCIIIGLGAGNAVVSYLRVLCVNVYGARLSQTLRCRLFSHAMGQSALWFDTTASVEG